MSNFKVGDRVMCTKEDYVATPGEKGTIRVIEHHNDDRDFGVELDNDLGGHDLDINGAGAKCKDGHGWWAAAENIRLLENRFEVGQIYRVGKLSSQHQYENSIVKLAGNRPFGFTVKAIRGEAPNDFGKCSEYGRSLTLLTGPQIGEAIRKWDAEHAKKPEPEYNEVKQAAKVGDTVRILKDCGGKVKPGKIGTITQTFGGSERVEIDGIDGFIVYKSHGDYEIISSGKHSYTAEQIKEARERVFEMIHDIYADGSEALFFSGHDKKVYYAVLIANGANCRLKTDSGPFGNPATIHVDDSVIGLAKCSNHDEPNEWIGRCVALCKALHKPVPAFIMGDGGRHFDFEKAKRLGRRSKDCFVIHCKNSDETHELGKILDGLGYKWGNGKRLNERFYSDNISYCIYTGGEVYQIPGKESSSAEFSDCFAED